MTTTFLAAVIGWYCLILGTLTLFQQKNIKAVLTDIAGSRGLFFVMTLITFIIGLLLVLSHRIWVADWRVAVTIFSWVLLLSAVFRLAYTDVALKGLKAAIKHPTRLTATGVFFVLFALYLLFHVYHQ